jgi:rubrerythrin
MVRAYKCTWTFQGLRIEVGEGFDREWYASAYGGKRDYHSEGRGMPVMAFDEVTTALCEENDLDAHAQMRIKELRKEVLGWECPECGEILVDDVCINCSDIQKYADEYFWGEDQR